MQSPSHWTTTSIRWCFYILLFVTPLLFYTQTSELFEFNKMIFVYFVTTAVASLWLWQIITTRQVQVAKSIFTLPILVYLSVNILATIFSIDRHVSLFGYYSRFNGGLLSTICYSLLYFAFVTFCAEKKTLYRSLQFLIASSLLVSIYAVLERLGIDKNVWVQDVQARVFSTFGQPNWLAAFLAMVIPFQLVFFMQAKTLPKKSIHFAGFLLNYLAFTFTYSRGGTLGLVAGLLLFVIGIALLYRQRFPYKLGLIVGGTMLVVLILFGNALFRESQFHGFVNDRFPVQTTSQSSDSQLDQPGTESSQIRLIVWRGALDIFRHHPILGTGVETFAYAYYQYRPAVHNQTTEWDFLYNKAHNEYLNELATKGLVGFAGYLFLIGTFWFVVGKILLPLVLPSRSVVPPTKTTGMPAQPADPEQTVFVLAIAASYLSYLVQNIFGFSVVMIAVLFYLLPAMLVIVCGTPNWFVKPLKFLSLGWIRTAGYLITICFAGFCFVFIAQLWVADLFYAKGYNAALSGIANTAYEDMLQAISMNTREPLYRSELGYVSAELVQPALTEHEATLAGQLQDDAVGFTQSAVHQSPASVPYLRNAVKAYTQLAAINSKYTATALYFAQDVVNRSPTDPQDRLRLAELLQAASRTNEAQEQYAKAVALKPDYRDARLDYANFLATQAGFSDEQSQNAKQSLNQTLLHQAIDQLKYYLDHVNGTDAEIQQRVTTFSAALT